MDTYELIVVSLPGSDAQVYVRRWETGQIDVDYRENPSATWVPIHHAGGTFRIEESR